MLKEERFRKIFRKREENACFFFNLCYNQVESFRISPQLQRARLIPQRQAAVLEAQSKMIAREMQRRLEQARRRIASGAALCESLSPYHVLARGYAVVKKNGKVLRSAADAAPGDVLNVTLTDGAIRCETLEIMQGERTL